MFLEADIFWFSFFHELAHIVLGIPSAAFSAFKEVKDFSEDNIKQFAKSQNVDPGIIVGRLQREGLIKYNELNNLKERYILSDTEFTE